MIATRRFLIITLVLALVSIPAAVFSTEDISRLLETKGLAARGIVTKPSIFREAKLTHLLISQKQLEFLIDNPHVALALAHLYAPFLDNYRVTVLPDQVVHIEDPGTLAGAAELIDVRPGRRVYFISGYYNLLKMRFHGDIALITEYSEHQENAAVTLDATVTAYIKIKSAFAGALARFADFLFPKKVDERLERFLHAAENISDAIRKDPTDVYRKLEDSREVSAEELEAFGRTF